MKLITKIVPKRLFRSKTSSRSISRSESSASADSPTTVLPDASAHWSIHSDLVHAFKMMDKDGDGKITQAQLESVLIRIRPDPLTPDEIKVMLAEIDSDGDGCISLEEFGAIGSAFEPTARDDELKKAFEFFDTDHDGKITAEELHEAFVALGDEGCNLEQCRCMVAGVGRSGDGFVCFEDFARMMELQQ